jgi:anti-sigma B factor antagonist
VKISARRMEKVTIFDISGNIDLSQSPEVRKVLLKEMREASVPRVMLNLSDVNYIDSSGIASLVEGLKLSRELNSRFILFGLSTNAREVLQISRLLSFFEIYENEEQAVAAA